MTKKTIEEMFYDGIRGNRFVELVYSLYLHSELYSDFYEDFEKSEENKLVTFSVAKFLFDDQDDLTEELKNQYKFTIQVIGEGSESYFLVYENFVEDRLAEGIKLNQIPLNKKLLLIEDKYGHKRIAIKTITNTDLLMDTVTELIIQVQFILRGFSNE